MKMTKHERGFESSIVIVKMLDRKKDRTSRKILKGSNISTVDILYEYGNKKSQLFFNLFIHQTQSHSSTSQRYGVFRSIQQQKNSGAHSRVATLIQPSFQKKNAHFFFIEERHPKGLHYTTFFCNQKKRYIFSLFFSLPLLSPPFALVIFCVLL